MGVLYSRLRFACLSARHKTTLPPDALPSPRQWRARQSVSSFRSKLCALFAFVVLVFCASARAGQTGSVRGTVTDPLGAPIAHAAVTLIRRGRVTQRAHSDAEGHFLFSSVPEGRYRVGVSAPGFTPSLSASTFLRTAGAIRLKVRLRLGALRQRVTVTATGTNVPQTQVGASVSILNSKELDAVSKLDVLDTLRLLPGVEVTQEGERGSLGSVYVRGGDSDFEKVLVDGIAVNDIGGAFDFSNLATSGVDQVEVYRGPDSILYGSDALAGVINITTQRGSTATPQFTYSADGGNFESLRQEASFGGVFRNFDYFSDFMRFDTQNSLPNNSFHNATYTGNFGWQPVASASVRFTIHHDATGLGSSNALALYGIPDDSFQREQDTDLGLTAQDQTTSRWHNTLRLTSAHVHYLFDTPAPAGIPSTASGFGVNYVGDYVKICGANGYCASGQAVLDYGGVYPMIFNSLTTVRTVYGQTDYQFSSNVAATGGFQYINESGSSSTPASTTARNNYDGFLESRANAWRRLFGTAGVGFESNAVFGFAATPRASLAYYLRRPDSAASFGHTEFRFNFGTGIEEPSLLEQASSLYTLLSQTAGGAGLIHQYSISPIDAERSTSLDAGVEQGFWKERIRLGATYFHNRDYDLIDFVPQTALPTLGVPPSVAAQVPDGAYFNSDADRSQGAELEFAARPTPGLSLQLSYTYLDAIVTRSFSSSALFPAINPAFPNVPIGAYAPLVGGRPFRRPANTASFMLLYSPHPRYGFGFNGLMAGPADDSTFLTDAFFGDTLLLPNHDLLAGYQLIGFSGWYELERHITLYTSMSNILDEHYQAAFGYPALPFNFRAGVRFTLGGKKE